MAAPDTSNSSLRNRRLAIPSAIFLVLVVVLSISLSASLSRDRGTVTAATTDRPPVATGAGTSSNSSSSSGATDSDDETTIAPAMEPTPVNLLRTPTTAPTPLPVTAGPTVAPTKATMTTESPSSSPVGGPRPPSSTGTLSEAEKSNVFGVDQCCPDGYTGYRPFDQCRAFYRCVAGRVTGNTEFCRAGSLFDDERQLCRMETTECMPPNLEC